MKMNETALRMQMLTWADVIDVEALLNLGGMLVFDGPHTSHILGNPYITVAAVGDDKLKVIARFIMDMREYIGSATQLAWRLRPQIEENGEEFKIRARCFVFNGDAEWHPELKIEASANVPPLDIPGVELDGAEGADNGQYGMLPISRDLAAKIKAEPSAKLNRTVCNKVKTPHPSRETTYE